MAWVTGRQKQIHRTRLLGPEVINKASTSNIISAQTDINLDIPFIAGANLKAGYVASIGNDGLLYHASVLATNDLPAHGFILNDVNSGDVAFLREDRIINSIPPFTNYGKPIYLREDNGTENYSEFSLSTSSGTEDIYQKVGYKNSVGEILINIQEPLYFV